VVVVLVFVMFDCILVLFVFVCFYSCYRCFFFAVFLLIAFYIVSVSVCVA